MEFKKPIYPIEQWNITETEFKKKIITEMRRHLRCLTATLAQEELSRRRIHSMWIPVWKETSSTAFMKAMRSAMERRILVHRF